MTTLLILSSAAAMAIVLLARHRRTRETVYTTLADRRRHVGAEPSPAIAVPPPMIPLARQFDQQRLVSVPGFLEGQSLERLIRESLGNRRRVERSFIPRHKKGGTLSYEAIHHVAPACLAFYLSPALRRWLSALIGTEVYPTADHDQSSCSLLVYDRAGDHIGWHFDYNFYRGRHFTVLLSLLNRRLPTDVDLPAGLSEGQLQHRVHGQVATVETPPNTLVVFEGKRVFHRATAIGEDQERVMLSMTFSTDPRVHPWKEAGRRIKDMAYFGPRVLFG